MKESCESAKLRAAKHRTIRSSALIIIAYILCWSPYQILQLVKISFTPWFRPLHLDGVRLDCNPRLRYETYAQQFQHINVLVVLNAVVNPFLYGMFGNLKVVNLNVHG